MSIYRTVLTNESKSQEENSQIKNKTNGKTVIKRNSMKKTSLIQKKLRKREKNQTHISFQVAKKCASIRENGN